MDLGLTPCEINNSALIGIEDYHRTLDIQKGKFYELMSFLIHQQL